MSNKQVVLAIFPDTLAADSAATTLKETGIVMGDAVGILALNSSGELEVDKVGARSTGKGAGIGAVLFLLGPAVAGVGVVGGALAGALHHKGLGLSPADKDRITKELTAGKAAVGVLAGAAEAPAVAATLAELGGVSETHDASDEALDQAAAEAAQ